jgi:hypothetical protein
VSLEEPTVVSVEAPRILELRGRDLDQAYMRDLATQMGVADLLQRILEQAGLVDWVAGGA